MGLNARSKRIAVETRNSEFVVNIGNWGMGISNKARIERDDLRWMTLVTE